MEAQVTVVLPWRGGCPHRAAALRWVCGRYAATHPDWDLVLAEAPAGPWCKAAAVWPALPPDGVVVVADADVWSDAVGVAVDNVVAGAAWAVPHHAVRRLAARATAEVLAGAEPSTVMALTQRAYVGTAAGGIAVMAASTARAVPLDPAFTGWGDEDRAWRDALRSLAGPEARGADALWHLHHPPQPRLSRTRGSAENARLATRYADAASDPRAMRALIASAHDRLHGPSTPLPRPPRPDLERTSA